MQKVIVVYSSNRSIEREFYCTLLLLAKMGAHVIEQHGAPDLGFARCAALTLVLNTVLADRAQYDTVLMLDDDMVVTPDVILDLVEHARKTGRPASACYVLANGHIAGEPHPLGFVTGLGCIAIPTARLLELASAIPAVRFSTKSGAMIRAFTFSGIGPDETEWMGEDYRLCLRLGGVDLLPLAAGHIKKRVLLPTPEAMHAIIGQKK